jgi:two-component system sensor kinase FixL
MEYQPLAARPDQSFSDTARLFRLLASAVPVGLAFIDLDMRYLVVNEAFAAMVGRSPAYLAGRPLSDTVVPTLWQQIDPIVRRAMTTGEGTYDYELLQPLPGGTALRWTASYVPLRSGGRIVGVGISILDGKAADTKPAASGQTEEIEEIQYTLDIDRYHPASSDSVMDLLGIQRDDFTAESGGMFLNTLYSDGADKPGAGRLPLEDGDTVAIERRLVSPDGSERWVHQRSEVRVGESGRQTLVGTVQHITERSEAETRLHAMQADLLHVSRLSAIGQVSSTVAHEVNQPLTAIGNYIRASLLMLNSAEPVPNSKIRAVLDKAALQTTRASEIVRNLREFARKGDISRSPENLSVVVQEAMALARLGIKDRGLRVRLRLAGDCRWATINRVQIQQVLVNLIRNAIEAMADGVRRELVVATASAGTDLIEVSVADSGSGLSQDVVSDLFKPFVTTKSQGMGVGLAICQTIVAAHKGKIWAEPNPAGGTIFRFTVERASEGEAAAS